MAYNISAVQVLMLCCLAFCPVSGGPDAEPEIMPEGFAYLKLRSTTRKGTPTSDYRVRFEKQNTGNIAVHVDLSPTPGVRAQRGELAYRYFPPNGVLYEDSRSRDGFSQILEDILLDENQVTTRVLLRESHSFFSLGNHRLEIWWRSSKGEPWRKAGAILFEIVW